MRKEFQVLDLNLFRWKHQLQNKAIYIKTMVEAGKCHYSKWSKFCTERSHYSKRHKKTEKRFSITHIDKTLKSSSQMKLKLMCFTIMAFVAFGEKRRKFTNHPGGFVRFDNNKPVCCGGSILSCFPRREWCISRKENFC